MSEIFDSSAFDENSFETQLTSTIGHRPMGVLPQLMLPPRKKRTPFTDNILMLSTIKKPLHITIDMAGAIHKPFTSEAYFTATTIKQVNESISVISNILSAEVTYEMIEKIFEE